MKTYCVYNDKGDLFESLEILSKTLGFKIKTKLKKIHMAIIDMSEDDAKYLSSQGYSVSLSEEKQIL